MRWWHTQRPPDRQDTTAPTPRDPAFDVKQEDYQADKQEAVKRRAELLARLQRIGYDFDIATRQDRREPQ